MARASSGKTALEHAIEAAQLYMEAARVASSPAERARLRRKCEDMIAEGEKLKAPAAGPAARQPVAPQQSRELSTAEKIILLRSSKLHGLKFPPWESDPADETFRPGSGSEKELFRCAKYVPPPLFSFANFPGEDTGHHI